LINWNEAFRHIRQRSASDVIGSVALEPPFTWDLGASFYETTDFIAGFDELSAFEGKYITSFPGKSVRFAADCLFCTKRYLHALDCARQSFSRGALTWSLVEGHHTLLLGLKAVACFYGLFLHQVWDRTVLIDFLPDAGRPSETKAFVQEFGAIDSPVALLLPRSAKLDQRPLRALLQHIGNVAVKKTQEEKDFFRALDRFSKASGKSPRNNVMYSSVFWLWPADTSLLEESAEVKAAKADSEESGYPHLMNLLDEMEISVRGLLNILSNKVGFEASSLHPLVAHTERRSLVC
jgi:hypothetical protein